MHVQGLPAWQSALEEGAKRAKKDVAPIVKKGALQIKNRLQSEMGASTHFSPVRRGINFDIETKGFGGEGVIQAEIGPERGFPGSLANIAYFGTSKGGGTVPDPELALLDEAKVTEEFIADATVQALS